MADRKPFPTPFMEIKNVNDVDQKEKVLEKYLPRAKRPIVLAELFRSVEHDILGLALNGEGGIRCSLYDNVECL